MWLALAALVALAPAGCVASYQAVTVEVSAADLGLGPADVAMMSDREVARRALSEVLEDVLAGDMRIVEGEGERLEYRGLLQADTDMEIVVAENLRVGVAERDADLADHASVSNDVLGSYEEALALLPGLPERLRALAPAAPAPPPVAPEPPAPRPRRRRTG